MRVVIGVLLVFLLASCGADESVDPTNAPNVTDPLNVSNVTENVSVTEPAANLSNATNTTNVSLPPARLSDSVLGIVPSDDPAPRIVSFALISGFTDKPIDGFENMTGIVRIDRARVPSSLGLRANYAGDVESVLFSLDDDENYRVENDPPFSLTGDAFGVYTSWYPNKGAYEITATPYARPDAVGDHEQPVSIRIEFYAEDYLDRMNP